MLLLDFITFRHNTGNGAQCATDIEVLSAKFGNGNDKLGKGMGLWTFDLPPIKTCPGSTDAICRESRPYSKQGMEQVCWACRKRYCQPKLQTLREVNYQFSQSDAFVPWANGKISRSRAVNAVRLPGTGDMYSVEFVRKVRAIIQANPKIRFWIYTRCWAVPNIWKELQTLSGEANVTLWLCRGAGWRWTTTMYRRSLSIWCGDSIARRRGSRRWAS